VEKQGWGLPAFGKKANTWVMGVLVTQRPVCADAEDCLIAPESFEAVASALIEQFLGVDIDVQDRVGVAEASVGEGGGSDRLVEGELEELIAPTDQLTNQPEDLIAPTDEFDVLVLQFQRMGDDDDEFIDDERVDQPAANKDGERRLRAGHRVLE
jgi:hypothetical protein|tara:strand:- start:303 stop:767 length:465 start_codon:yes stop_codon:yes gene_type:complete